MPVQRDPFFPTCLYSLGLWQTSAQKSVRWWTTSCFSVFITIVMTFQRLISILCGNLADFAFPWVMCCDSRRPYFLLMLGGLSRLDGLCSGGIGLPIHCAALELEGSTIVNTARSLWVYYYLLGFSLSLHIYTPYGQEMAIAQSLR